MENSYTPFTKGASSIIFQCSGCKFCYVDQDDLEKHIGERHYPKPTDVVALLLVHKQSYDEQTTVEFMSQPRQLDADQESSYRARSKEGPERGIESPKNEFPILSTPLQVVENCSGPKYGLRKRFSKRYTYTSDQW